MDGFAFALTFSLSTDDFGFFLDSSCDLAERGLYFEGDDGCGMAEGAYLRGRHGDDPGLERCYEIGGVERSEFCCGQNETIYEFREGGAKAFECGEFGGEGIYGRVFLERYERGGECGVGISPV